MSTEVNLEAHELTNYHTHPIDKLQYSILRFLPLEWKLLGARAASP